MQDAVKELTQVITEYPRATIIQATATSSEIGKGQYSMYTSAITGLY